MIPLPRWLVFFVAFWVLVWGAYRVYLGARKLRERRQPADPARPSFRRKGLFARSPRADIIYGIVFLLMGGYLAAMGFGVGLPR